MKRKILGIIIISIIILAIFITTIERNKTKEKIKEFGEANTKLELETKELDAKNTELTEIIEKIKEENKEKLEEYEKWKKWNEEIVTSLQ